MTRSARVCVAILAIGLVAAACSSGPASSRTTAQNGATSDHPTTTTAAPLPAGVNPSAISKMVCSAEAQKDIAEAIGVTPTTVRAPTWVNHTYSCVFVYPHGQFTLSVNELSSWSQTYAFFDNLQTTKGDTDKLTLGQGAFQTSNGSVVVRKDWKVLQVDIAGLPAQFGSPPTPRSDVAFTIADVILGCWAGD